jgi:adenylate cyclase
LTSAPHADTLASRTSRIRVAAALLVAVLVSVMAALPRWSEGLREAWFDGYQRIAPRVVESLPATVVEIDAPSLEAVGRWPWPRSILAELVTRLAAHQPAAVGLDILMPEPDSRGRGGMPGDDARGGENATGNDALLARALATIPAVLAIAGMPEYTGATVRAPAIAVQGSTDPATLSMLRFRGALGSLEALSTAASG